MFIHRKGIPVKRFMYILLAVAVIAAVTYVVPIYYRHYMVQNFLEDAAHYAVVEKDNDKVAKYFIRLLKEEGIDAKIRKSMMDVDNLQFRVGVVRTFTLVEVRFDYYEVIEIPYVNLRHQFSFIDMASWPLE